MARQFKPVRFFVLMALLAFIVCGVTAFYTHRAATGRSPGERSGYAIGVKAGETAPPDAILPTAAGLHTLAASRFAQEGSGESMAWKSAFARGYEEGFAKTHRRP